MHIPYFCHLPICVIRCFTLLIAISSTCEVVLDVLDFVGVVTVPDVLGTACVVTVPDVVGTGGEVTVLDVLGITYVVSGSRLRLTIVLRCNHTPMCTYPLGLPLSISSMRCFTLFCCTGNPSMPFLQDFEYLFL